MIKNYIFRATQECNPSDRYVFILQTNFVTNFIARYLIAKKISYGKVDLLSVEINSSLGELFVYEQVLEARLKFKYCDLNKLKYKERVEKIIELVNQSSLLHEEKISGISLIINEATKSFERLGYKNISTTPRKRVKGIGFAKLECELTMFDFSLSLVVENKEGEIYRKKIMETDPEALIYHSFFKKIAIKDSEIQILDRICEKPIFSVSFEGIAEQENGCFHDLREGMIYDSSLGYFTLEDNMEDKETMARWNQFKNDHKAIQNTNN